MLLSRGVDTDSEGASPAPSGVGTPATTPPSPWPHSKTWIAVVTLVAGPLFGAVLYHVWKRAHPDAARYANRMSFAVAALWSLGMLGLGRVPQRCARLLHPRPEPLEAIERRDCANVGGPGWGLALDHRWRDLPSRGPDLRRFRLSAWRDDVARLTVERRAFTGSLTAFETGVRATHIEARWELLGDTAAGRTPAVAYARYLPSRDALFLFAVAAEHGYVVTCESEATSFQYVVPVCIAVARTFEVEP